MTFTYKRPISIGSRGRDVYAVKRALKKAGYRKGIILNNKFGRKADNQLKALQKHVGLKPDGIMGPLTFRRLAPYFDAYGRWLYASYKPPKPTVSRTRQRIVEYAHWAVNNAWRIHYAQVRPIPSDPRRLPQYTDCSGTAKLAYKDAGAPSPDGLPWGAGNTDTLQARGHYTVNPKPGDLIFYERPDHVGIYIGGGKVIEHGGESGPKVVSEWYRTVTNVRSYLGD